MTVTQKDLENLEQKIAESMTKTIDPLCQSIKELTTQIGEQTKESDINLRLTKVETKQGGIMDLIKGIVFPVVVTALVAYLSLK